MKHIQECRRWLRDGQEPTLPYVIRTADGALGEALNPFYLCDLLFDEHFSDCDDPRTWVILFMKKLRDLAKTFYAFNFLRVTVYDAKGRFYDNFLSHPDHQDELEFTNMESPIILDGFNPYTAIKSLIRGGYIELWEKYPTFSESNKTSGCSNCVFNENQGEGKYPYCHGWDYEDAQYDWETPCFWLTNGEKMQEYKYVNPDEIEINMNHRSIYLPPEQRTEDYLGFNVDELRKHAASMKEE